MLHDSAGVRDVGAMSRVLGTTFGTDASMGGTRACVRDNGETPHFPVGGGCSSLPGDQNSTLLTTRGALVGVLLLPLLKAAMDIFRVVIIVSNVFRRVASFRGASCSIFQHPTCFLGAYAHPRFFCVGICTSEVAIVLWAGRLAVSPAGGGENF